jgi:hypothetical protein
MPIADAAQILRLLIQIWEIYDDLTVVRCRGEVL